MKAIVLTFALALSACAAPCQTADLDAKYAIDLVKECDTLPLSECPEAGPLGDAYEADVTERLESCGPN